MLCRRLKCTWSELQELPEDLYDCWEAIISGEEHAAREKAAAAAG